ncbi:ribose 5-phosphate isomerase A [Tanacetum coccineum]|uniref:Ribose 5-phosphate isomerase A n=1 Tax=Tanacetum coccineum TaxID=301880 RepID=A0ABQ4X849_9ASTR
MYLKQHTNKTIQKTASRNGRSSRFEPSLSHHVVHDLPSSSQQPSMQELKDDENEDKVSDVEIIAVINYINQHENILRTAKMMTKDVYKLIEGEKILVNVNDKDQLIKDAAGLCTRTKYKLYELVKSRLDEANNIGVDEVHELEYTEDQILHALDLVDAPSKVHDHQWESYKAQLRSSKSRKLSEIGKKARGEKLHTHRTGAVSFARVRHEFKSKHKRSPGFVEIFEIQHTGADGSYVEDASRNLVVKANKEISRKISELGCPEEEIDNEKRAAIDREVWIDLVGPGGEVLGYGAGVTKSDVTSFNNELRKMRGENYMNSNYVHKLLAQTKSQNSVIESQNRTIASLNKKVEELENTVGGFRDELKLFQTMFQGACGSSDMFFPTQAVSHKDYTGYGKKKKKHSSRKN